MPRGTFTIAFAAALLLAGPASAQRSDVKNPATATAPMKMMPPGESKPTQECDKMAMAPQVKIQNRARFVNSCIARKMNQRKAVARR